jgi:hypothetical protein
MPKSDQSFADLFEVIYFTVIDDVYSSVLTGHGLPPSLREINHRQPLVTQTYAGALIKKKARSIRATM